MDFTKYLGLTSEGPYMFVAKSPDYDRIRFVVYFQVYGIKHWKPRNWGRVGDADLCLVWALLNKSGVNRVKFIICKMLYYKAEPKSPLFFSSFVHMILEINRIMSKEEDFEEAPKILDESGVSMMIYYRDTNGVYHYLEKYEQNVYDDKIVEPVKDPSDEGLDALKCINHGQNVTGMSQPNEQWFQKVMQLSGMRDLTSEELKGESGKASRRNSNEFLALNDTTLDGKYTE
ncbi:hypothetical protein KIW84_063625 [Lathyrus oleraceus]|uniref:Uncharacterized protein n=1 Tax=Pisum sativum TaxID=3888 RepID=A0A9D5A9W2_PEA|nr:hypothetical protein KIW84_063625 [Pisum sativum]